MNFINTNTSEFKFADFSKEIHEIPSEFRDENWYQKLEELDTILHLENRTEQYTFTDDRLVFVAFKVMSETGMYEQTATIREWYIVHRYAQLYLPTTQDYTSDLLTFVSMYVGFNFTDAEMNDEDANKIAALAQSLQNIDLSFLPTFVINAIDEVAEDAPKKKGKKKKATPVIEEETPATTGSEDAVRAEFEGIKALAEMMLSGELSEEARTEFEGILALSKMMLGEE